jgi:hypothetical protein
MRKWGWQFLKNEGKTTRAIITKYGSIEMGIGMVPSMRHIFL